MVKVVEAGLGLLKVLLSVTRIEIFASLSEKTDYERFLSVQSAVDPKIISPKKGSSSSNFFQFRKTVFKEIQRSSISSHNNAKKRFFSFSYYFSLLKCIPIVFCYDT